MNNLTETIFLLLILSGFGLLGSSRLMTCISITAFQGAAVGLLIPVVSSELITVRTLFVSVAIIALKGFVFPRLLSSALRESNTSREVQPFVGYVGSLLIGVFLLVFSFWVDSKVQFPVVGTQHLFVPVAFFLFLAGLFLIVARRTAVNQVLGYLVMENGIYILGFAVVRETPILVELGVLLDVFVAVFVMGIAIYRISREFDHIDSDQLRSLKG